MAKPVVAQSAFVIAVEQIAAVRGPEGRFIQTDPFLEICRLVLPVVDKLGTAFMLVKNDINGNIQRLDDRVELDTSRNSQLFTIILDEVVRKTHNDSNSCTKGLLWLKRAMEFMVALLQRVHDDDKSQLTVMVSETYTATLYKYHGFFASSAFSLAFKFVPSRETFLMSLGDGPGVTTMQDMQAFITDFGAVLADIHQFLVENQLDDPTKV